MSPRGDDHDGREREPVHLDCDALYALATRFSPVLRFHEDEQFFPVLAESWLTHTTQAPWADDPAHHFGDVAPDPNRRGIALCELVDDKVKVFAGQPVGRDRPLQFSDDPGDPYAIGSKDLRRVGAGVFLDLAGWPAASGLTTGDIDRLRALFSELAGAINPNASWQPLFGEFDLPHAWVPQPVSPTAYCEVSACEDFLAIGDAAGGRDFPPGEDTMARFLALTYHYLFPAKDRAADDGGPRHEGQWEAITLFFEGEGLRDGRGVAYAPPQFVTISQGIVQSMGDHHGNEVRDWPRVQRVGEHPVIYVAKGTHRFYFEPVTGQTTNPRDNPKPGQDPGSHDDDRHEGAISDFAYLGLLLLALGILAAIFGWIGLAIALILLALWLLFEWLKSLFDSGDNDSSGEPVPANSGNDEASDNGAQAGGDEPPGAPPAPDGPGQPGFGLPNTGSPTGRATVSFDVRLVDRLHHEDDERRTGYPSPQRCEHPYWWDYSGGWGVRVRNPFSSGWEHGTRRVDEHGRSWSYWNALRLSTWLHGGADKG